MKPPSHVLRLDHPLRAMFAPRTVAVIGATEKPGSVGRTVLKNLISSPFGGGVFPVNLHRADVLGVPLGYLTDYLGRIISEAKAPVAGVVMFVRAVPSLSKGETIAYVGPVLTGGDR